MIANAIGGPCGDGSSDRPRPPPSPRRSPACRTSCRAAPLRQRSLRADPYSPGEADNSALSADAEGSPVYRVSRWRLRLGGCFVARTAVRRRACLPRHDHATLSRHPIRRLNGALDDGRGRASGGARASGRRRALRGAPRARGRRPCPDDQREQREENEQERHLTDVTPRTASVRGVDPFRRVDVPARWRRRA